jgi:hypothetical protein
MFELITTYYKAAEPEREAENLQCLVNNLKHPLISRINLFLQSNERPYLFHNDKIHYVQHGSRPTFSELFEYGNKIGNKVFKIVANSDIYFDETLELAAKALNKWDVLALTRWDCGSNNELNFFANFKSQDTWIFRDKLPHTELGAFFIGQYGCDNRLLFEFKNCGLKVGNPSFDLKTIHLHNSGFRNYLKDPNYQFVKEPYGYITPHYLNKNKFTKFKNKNFVNLNYQYYKSAKNNTLPSVHFNYHQRLVAFIKTKFYAFLTNKLT